MEEDKKQMIAPCGIDCGPCDIRKAPSDPAAAKRLVAWFKEMGWLKEDEGIAEVLERSMYCRGCRGDRSVHWGVDDDKICEILKCCVDDKGLEFCCECGDFPCEKLVEWAEQYDHHGQALERLKQMRG